MFKFKDFDDWIQQVEHFHILIERFDETFRHLPGIDQYRIRKWVRAAFEAAREQENGQ